MDDSELQQLLRMAREAEELAESADPVSIPLRPVWRRPGAWAGLSGLAAAAAIAWMVAPGAGPSVTPADLSPIVLAPEEAAPPEPMETAMENTDTPPVRIVNTKPAVEPEQSVVFAIFRDPEGGCSCVQMEDADWGTRRLADVGRNELLAAVLDEPCTTMARQVLVVGVSGKPGTLPASHDAAERLALRLASVPINEHQDVSLAAYAAMPELPIGSTVVAEAVSFFRR